MNIKLNKKDLTTILQSLENEYKITTGVDDMMDEETKKWAEELERVTELIKKEL